MKTFRVSYEVAVSEIISESNPAHNDGYVLESYTELVDAENYDEVLNRFATDEYTKLEITELVIGQPYWIFTGRKELVRAILSGFNGSRRVAEFGAVGRKLSSVYTSREEAIRKGNY